MQLSTLLLFVVVMFSSALVQSRTSTLSPYISESLPVSPNVNKILSVNGFKTVLQSTPFIVVKFFSPICGACNAIKDHFDQVAERFVTHPSFSFAEIDCTREELKSLCRKHQVRYYPSIQIIPSPHHTIPPHLDVDYQYLQPSFTASTLSLFLLQYIHSLHPFPKETFDLKKLISATAEAASYDRNNGSNKNDKSIITTINNPILLHLQTFSEVQAFFTSNPSPYKILLLLTIPKHFKPTIKQPYHFSQQYFIDLALSFLTHYPSVGTIVTFSDLKLLSNAMIIMQDFYPAPLPSKSSSLFSSDDAKQIRVPRTTPRPKHIEQLYQSLLQRQQILSKKLDNNDSDHRQINSLFDFTSYTGTPLSTSNGDNKIVLYTALPSLPVPNLSDSITQPIPTTTILSRNVLIETYFHNQILHHSLPILSPLTPQDFPLYKARNKPIVWIFYPQSQSMLIDTLYPSISNIVAPYYNQFSFGYVDSIKYKTKVQQFKQEPYKPSLVIQHPTIASLFVGYQLPPSHHSSPASLYASLDPESLIVDTNTCNNTSNEIKNQILDPFDTAELYKNHIITWLEDYLSKQNSANKINNHIYHLDSPTSFYTHHEDENNPLVSCGNSHEQFDNSIHYCQQEEN